MQDHGGEAEERGTAESGEEQTFDEALGRLIRLGLVLDLGGDRYAINSERLGSRPRA